MTQPHWSDETARRGRELYQKAIRPQVETAANIGKIVSIDVETGDYEIDDDQVKAAERLRSRRPSADIWSERIGYDAVYAVGGSLNR